MENIKLTSFERFRISTVQKRYVGVVKEWKGDSKRESFI